MARLSIRLLGLLLLTFGITVSSCQALFPRQTPDDVPPFRPGFQETGQR